MSYFDVELIVGMRKNVEVRDSCDGDGDTGALRVFRMELIEKKGLFKERKFLD